VESAAEGVEEDAAAEATADDGGTSGGGAAVEPDAGVDGVAVALGVEAESLAEEETVAAVRVEGVTAGTGVAAAAIEWPAAAVEAAEAAAEGAGEAAAAAGVAALFAAALLSIARCRVRVRAFRSKEARLSLKCCV
jgi:hypothetical protein